jgi:flagellar assembly protein FliH
VLNTEQPPGFVLADAEAWAAPVIDDGGVATAGRRLTAEELYSEQQRVLAQAEAQGRAAGLAAAKQEIDAQRKALAAEKQGLVTILDALARPLAQLDDTVHEQIALLAIQLARGLVRRELRTDPTQVIGIVRDTVALLPVAARGVRVLLHPEDAALLRERLVTSGPAPAWEIIDDPALARGDCRVHTDYAQIDARVETRLKAALAALLGDERAQQRGGEET